MNPIRKVVVGAALVGATVAGGAIGASLIGSASAQTSTTTTPSSSASTAAPTDSGSAQSGGAPASFDPTKGGHVGANGVKEELLTGDTADKVTAAALAAVPGGTIQRVENDAEGAVYEAHMTKADGSQVTVKLDANFTVTSIEDGAR
jgi:ABC-type transport system substrate-binding protein